MDDILLNKMASLEKCLNRIDEEYQNNSESFSTNITKQESIILNLQRTCEIVIDMANHIVRLKKLGLPQTSRDAFELLEKNKIITKEICETAKAMIGFRNIAVHEYEELNLAIVESIIQNKLGDLLTFSKCLLETN